MFHIIIETEDGLTTVEQAQDATAEETASKHHGTVVDAGPYRTREDAYDALLELQLEREEEIEAEHRV